MSQKTDTDTFELHLAPFDSRPFELANDNQQTPLVPAASDPLTDDVSGSLKGVSKDSQDGLVSLHPADPSLSSVAASKVALMAGRDRDDGGSPVNSGESTLVEYRLYKRRWVGVCALVRKCLAVGSAFGLPSSHRSSTATP